MRKSILLRVLFLVITIFISSSFLFQQKSFASDFKNCRCGNEFNDGKFACSSSSFTCRDNLFCRNINESSADANYSSGIDSFWGVECTEKTEVFNCKCGNPGVTGEFQNGFSCDGEPDKTSIMWCKDDNEACYNDSGASMRLESQVNYAKNNIFTPGGGPVVKKYQNNVAKGVICRTKAQQAEVEKQTKMGQLTCHCDTPDVKNKDTFWCDQQPDAGLPNAIRMRCGDTNQHVCKNQSGPEMRLKDVNFFPNDVDTTIYKAIVGVPVSGITCATAEEFKRSETVPCKCTGTDTKSFQCDGQASAYVISCKDSKALCKNGTGLTVPLMNDGANAPVEVEGRNSDFDTNFKGKTGLGVSCELQEEEVKPLPAVPPPPCAPGKTLNGVCKAFMTAFGEIDTDAGSFVVRIFAVLLAISGGLAVLLIMRAGYILMTSAGNGERVKKGREQLVAAIVGLLFIIFSFVILQVIGVEILRLPDFSGAVNTPGATEIPPGGTCNVNNNQCTSGYVCQYNNGAGQCVKQQTDITCNPNNGANQCPNGFVCQYNNGTGQCVKQQTDITCNPNNGANQCPNGFVCQYNNGSGQCIPAAGRTCDPNSTINQCPTGQRCVYNGSSGQCQ